MAAQRAACRRADILRLRAVRAVAPGNDRAGAAALVRHRHVAGCRNGGDDLHDAGLAGDSRGSRLVAVFPPRCPHQFPRPAGQIRSWCRLGVRRPSRACPRPRRAAPTECRLVRRFPLAGYRRRSRCCSRRVAAGVSQHGQALLVGDGGGAADRRLPLSAGVRAIGRRRPEDREAPAPRAPANVARARPRAGLDPARLAAPRCPGLAPHLRNGRPQRVPGARSGRIRAGLLRRTAPDRRPWRHRGSRDHPDCGAIPRHSRSGSRGRGHRSSRHDGIRSCLRRARPGREPAQRAHPWR